MKSHVSLLMILLILLISLAAGPAMANQAAQKQPPGHTSSLNTDKRIVKSIKSTKKAHRGKAVLNDRRPDIFPAPTALGHPGYADLPFYRALGINYARPTELLFAPEFSAYLKQGQSSVFYAETAGGGNKAMKNDKISRTGLKDNLPGGENTHKMDFAPYKYESRYKDNLFSFSVSIPATGNLTISPTVSYLLNENSSDKSKEKSLPDITEGELFYGGLNLIFNF